MAKLRKAARELLTLDESDPRRIFEGSALMKRMYKYGLLNENENKLDYILGLTIHRFMDRRLQTLVYRKNLARSVHHARVLIRQRHIRLGKNLTNVPSVMIRTDQEKNIDFTANSSLGGGRPGRNKRKALKRQNKDEE